MTPETALTATGLGLPIQVVWPVLVLGWQNVPLPNWALWLSPHDHTVPSLLTPRLCSPPAAMEMTSRKKLVHGAVRSWAWARPGAQTWIGVGVHGPTGGPAHVR